MDLHCGFGNAQVACHFLVAGALGDQREDLALARRQAVNGVGVNGGRWLRSSVVSRQGRRRSRPLPAVCRQERGSQGMVHVLGEKGLTEVDLHTLLAWKNNA